MTDTGTPLEEDDSSGTGAGTNRRDLNKDNHPIGSPKFDMSSEARQRSPPILDERLQSCEAEHQQINQHQLQRQQNPNGQHRTTSPLVRSKTFDASELIPVKNELHTKLERKKSHYSQLSKSNCQYHKIFKEISKDEQLGQSYTCALQKDILYQGRMFVSDHWICFHSKVFGKDTKIAIPVISVTHVKKTKTALLVPNAVVISTASDRYVFVSFLARDNTYKFLMSVCLHLEDPCNSSIPSSPQITFRGRTSPRTPRFPLSFHADFAELNGTLLRSRQDTEESSTSDSQTPDDDKVAGILANQIHKNKNCFYPVPPFLEALKCSDVSPLPEHQHQVKNLLHPKHSKIPKQETKQHGLDVKREDVRSRQTLSLNTLLCVYLFLVCILMLSSCFLTVKMLSLEHRLATLGPVTELAQPDDFLQNSDDVNRELFSELLSLNLKKLEKVLTWNQPISFHSHM
ncbi:GRAM domain-containing protein 2B isoform X1 [Syngnathus scovelli]|uniref:GRAM domain-containing protein 2B isoform X1 n=1 Tax=Syngnathus scovelli TaxID=161590 RepID=UPI00210F9948|nr:GRAM domain-containing protein 2B isoform X1 [Syngnathus scovelli]